MNTVRSTAITAILSCVSQTLIDARYDQLVITLDEEVGQSPQIHVHFKYLHCSYSIRFGTYGSATLFMPMRR